MKQSTTSTKRKRVSPWLIGCGGFGILFAGLITWGILQVADYPLVAPRVEQTVKEYKAAELPWVASDMVPPVSESQNAAIELKEGLALMGNEKTTSREAQLVEAWKSRNNAAIRAEFKKLDPIISKFIAASKKPKINFERDWNLGPDMLFPEYGEIKGVAKILSRRAVFRAQSGEMSAAISDLTAINRLSKLISQEPNLIAMLVGIACNAICIDGVTRVAAVRNDRASIAQLKKAVSTFNDDFDFKNAMRGEAMMGVTLIRNLRPADINKLKDLVSGEGSNIEYKKKDGLPDGIIMRAHFVRHLEAHMFIQDQLNKYPDDPMSAAVEIDRFATEQMDGIPKFSQIMNAILLPVFGQAAEAVAKSKTNKQMSLALLKSLEYKHSKGRLPRSLDEIGVKYVDRVSGEKIVSLNSGGVFRVYGYGRNAADDGGIRDPDLGKDDFGIQFPPKPWQ